MGCLQLRKTTTIKVIKLKTYVGLSLIFFIFLIGIQMWDILGIASILTIVLSVSMTLAITKKGFSAIQTYLNAAETKTTPTAQPWASGGSLMEL